MTYKDLKVYQRAYKLAIDLHLLLKQRIQEIDFTLANHLRRESREVIGYIADGFNRVSPKAKRFALYRAWDSTHRILMDLEFMKDIRNFPPEEYDQYFQEYETCAKQIYTLMRSVSSSSESAQPKQAEEVATKTSVKEAVAV